MIFRNLIIQLSQALFKRDVDRLLDVAMSANESGNLSNKDWQAFGDIALRYRSFLLD